MIEIHNIEKENDRYLKLKVVTNDDFIYFCSYHIERQFVLTIEIEHKEGHGVAWFLEDDQKAKFSYYQQETVKKELFRMLNEDANWKLKGLMWGIV